MTAVLSSGSMDTKPEKYHVYKRRWYILLLHSTFSLLQCWIWITFGPITFATQFAYDWSDGTIVRVPSDLQACGNLEV